MGEITGKWQLACFQQSYSQVFGKPVACESLIEKIYLIFKGKHEVSVRSYRIVGHP